MCACVHVNVCARVLLLLLLFAILCVLSFRFERFHLKKHWQGRHKRGAHSLGELGDLQGMNL